MRNAEALELAAEIVKQQREWLTKACDRLLSEKARQMMKNGDMPLAKLVDFLRQNGIQLVPHRSTPMVMELHMKGVKIDKFEPVLHVPDEKRGGELRPLDFFKYLHPEQFGDDIWKDGS
jgi:alpha-D-ribose 1-methylphosphonate 5-triphosphate diphosphatase PhnM